MFKNFLILFLCVTALNLKALDVVEAYADSYLTWQKSTIYENGQPIPANEVIKYEIRIVNFDVDYNNPRYLNSRPIYKVIDTFPQAQFSLKSRWGMRLQNGKAYKAYLRANIPAYNTFSGWTVIPFIYVN